MTKVIQIRVGRANELPNGDWDVDCSVTLVITGGLKILFETGGSWAADDLIASLSSLGVNLSDITHVFCSHGHSDHVGCLSLFPQASQIVGRDANKGSSYRNQQIPPRDKTIGYPIWQFPVESNVLSEPPSESGSSFQLQLITTPGHTGGCVSLIGSSTGSPFEFTDIEGTTKQVMRLAIVGDLWECANDDSVWPLLSEMAHLQEESRKFILDLLPDIIVPGHGPAFSPQKQ
ncbi:beta-lactamase-like protein [Obelidium mucronatum]|nr:beta-lactamase-like protein [Obelidium mucronatum]